MNPVPIIEVVHEDLRTVLDARSDLPGYYSRKHAPPSNQNADQTPLLHTYARWQDFRVLDSRGETDDLLELRVRWAVNMGDDLDLNRPHAEARVKHATEVSNDLLARLLSYCNPDNWPGTQNVSVTIGRIRYSLRRGLLWVMEVPVTVKGTSDAEGNV